MTNLAPIRDVLLELPRSFGALQFVMHDRGDAGVHLMFEHVGKPDRIALRREELDQVLRAVFHSRCLLLGAPDGKSGMVRLRQFVGGAR